MKIHIPNSAFLHNINALLSSFDPSDPDSLEITANSKWISIHPLGLSMIAALGKSVDPANIKCQDISATSGHYLKRMGLFDLIGINPKVKNIREHESSGRLIPLTAIKSSEDLDDFLKELVPLLHLDRDPRHSEAIQHIFSELIRNVLEHSETPYGGIVCAQYFESSHRIAIGVADTGIGLHSSITRSYSVANDLEAIKLALAPGVTGTTRRPGGTAQNAGFGLFLIKSISYINSDYFTIISGNRLYKLLKRDPKKGIKLEGDPLEDKHTIANIKPWRGVAVGVDISLDQTQEFKSLLEIIYQFYKKEVRGEKKRRYREPRFV